LAAGIEIRVGVCGAAWQAARRLATGATGGLPTRRRIHPAQAQHSRNQWGGRRFFLCSGGFYFSAGARKCCGIEVTRPSTIWTG